ncbi:MAG: urate hydroxylase PuuD [Gammaproteobacteria bacterium]|nr:urate hydroxylase PuuD [Gammaproteobacteria bacterium]
MDIITTAAGIEMLLRWGHFLAGITWIGLLYYFNFIQSEYFKVSSVESKHNVIQLLVPKAIWWFRWAAMATFITGAGIMGARGAGWSIDIYIGALLGTLMFANVWLIIWPNQKQMIEWATSATSSDLPPEDVAAGQAKAGLASRTNTLFSIPMLFFMGASSHFPHGFSVVALILAIAIIGAIEYNAVKNQWGLGPMKSVTGVIHSGLGLSVVLILLLEIFG